MPIAIHDHRAVLALAAPHLRQVEAVLASPALRTHLADTRRVAALACRLLQAQRPTQNFAAALTEVMARSRG